MSLIDSEVLLVTAIRKNAGYINELLELIKEVPEVDAVRVVRCKDCICFEKIDGVTSCAMDRTQPGEYAYCERGTTREELERQRKKTSATSGNFMQIIKGGQHGK